MSETENTVEIQSKPWLFKKGQSGNPAGKPKGAFSLKTYARKYLQEMTDEEKLDFMEGLPKEIIWKMAEGNPASELTGKDGKDLIPDSISKETAKKALMEYLNDNSGNIE